MTGKNKYLEFLLDWLTPLGAITSRPMFGGHCLYCDGIVFALVANNTLYLKADLTTRGRFESLRLRPFRPFDHKPDVMQYYEPPPEFFDDQDAMTEWGRAAVEAGRRATKKNPKPRK